MKPDYINLERIKEVKVLFTGGGTGGHVAPAIAIAEILKDGGMLEDCLFVGRRGGDENKAITNSGYKLTTIDISPIPRKISLKSFSAVYRLIKAGRDAIKIIRDFSPDIVVATGGYVSYPILKGAIKLKIPTAIHESNAYPGLVTRTLGSKCDVVLLGMKAAEDHLKKCPRIVISGNPVRRNFKASSYLLSRKALGIKRGEKLILSFGGSGGAEKMNEAMINLMREFSINDPSVRHIHATGRKSYHEVKESQPDLFDNGKNTRCRIVPYIENMPTLLSACDLAITRSGAMTVAEIMCCDTPSILIPSPNVAANHQYYNALYAKEMIGSHIIEEADLTSDALEKTVKKILASREKTARSSATKKCARGEECESIILHTLSDIVTSKKQGLP